MTAKDSDATSGRDKSQPTWEEVERTRTPLSRHPRADMRRTWRVCIIDRFFTTTSDLTSRPRPLKGRMRCLERLPSPKSWHPGYWQVVRVLGTRNIDRFTRRARTTNQVSQSILEETLADPKERGALASVETMGQAGRRWAGEFGAFCWRVVEPGVVMSRSMVESWRNGVQQRLFGMLWRDTLEMKGVRIVGRMAEVLDGMLEDALDDQPGTGKKGAREKKDREDKKS